MDACIVQLIEHHGNWIRLVEGDTALPCAPLPTMTIPTAIAQTLCIFEGEMHFAGVGRRTYISGLVQDMYLYKNTLSTTNPTLSPLTALADDGLRALAELVIGCDTPQNAELVQTSATSWTLDTQALEAQL